MPTLWAHEVHVWPGLRSLPSDPMLKSRPTAPLNPRQVGHTLMAGSVYDALRTVYPDCYAVYDPAGAHWNWLDCTAAH